ncbi:hypothetical protein D3C72_1613240 [compost metagenome]
MLGLATHALAIVEHPVNDASVPFALIVGAGPAPTAEANVAGNGMEPWARIGILVERAEVATLIDTARAADREVCLFADKNYHIQHAVHGRHIDHPSIGVGLDLGDCCQGKALPRCVLNSPVGLLARRRGQWRRRNAWALRWRRQPCYLLVVSGLNTRCRVAMIAYIAQPLPLQLTVNFLVLERQVKFAELLVLGRQCWCVADGCFHQRAGLTAIEAGGEGCVAGQTGGEQGDR